MHPSSSIHQEDSSVDCERKPFQGETTRSMEQSKRLPVVTVDYNYGLPLDCGPEEEERSHYDLPPRDHYNWNWIKKKMFAPLRIAFTHFILYVDQVFFKAN